MYHRKHLATTLAVKKSLKTDLTVVKRRIFIFQFTLMFCHLVHLKRTLRLLLRKQKSLNRKKRSITNGGQYLAKLQQKKWHSIVSIKLLFLPSSCQFLFHLDFRITFTIFAASVTLLFDTNSPSFLIEFFNLPVVKFYRNSGLDQAWCFSRFSSSSFKFFSNFTGCQHFYGL